MICFRSEDHTADVGDPIAVSRLLGAFVVLSLGIFIAVAKFFEELTVPVRHKKGIRNGSATSDNSIWLVIN